MMTIRETSKPPRGWKPGTPLPADVPAKRVLIPEHRFGFGATPIVQLRVANRKAGIRNPKAGHGPKKRRDEQAKA